MVMGSPVGLFPAGRRIWPWLSRYTDVRVKIGMLGPGQSMSVPGPQMWSLKVPLVLDRLGPRTLMGAEELDLRNCVDAHVAGEPGPERGRLAARLASAPLLQLV
jgi:hypothetical protein